MNGDGVCETRGWHRRLGSPVGPSAVSWAAMCADCDETFSEWSLLSHLEAVIPLPGVTLASDDRSAPQ